MKKHKLKKEIRPRFSMWHGACVHMACPFYLLIANAKYEVVSKNSTKWQKHKTFSRCTVFRKNVVLNFLQ